MGLRGATMAGLLLCTLGGCIIPIPIVIPPNYDASGTMPCSASASGFGQNCDWRAILPGSGQAVIRVTPPAESGRTGWRILDYRSGVFSARDGTAVETRKAGESWAVSLPEPGEYYLIPAALVAGA